MGNLPGEVWFDEGGVEKMEMVFFRGWIDGWISIEPMCVHFHIVWMDERTWVFPL